jgi:hydroxymethylglutaryl-CoA synthase
MNAKSAPSQPLSGPCPSPSALPIGIDAIAFAVPRGYVELSDLAEARGVPPTKYSDGLGNVQMAVAAPDEDPVTLAMEAASRLLFGAGRSPNEIGLCIVGTETAVDHSKPIASYLHGMLGLPQICRVFETKHACFGGTAGLFNALDWLASGSARGRSALIVCTDIARYPLRSPGEPTQGGGAVAMLISEFPRLLELNAGLSGCYAQHVHDFWRPLHRKDALVDGHFSVQCYLEALTGAYSEWQRLVGSLDGDPTSAEPLLRTCYHVPYGKMARKAHQRRCQLDGLDDATAEARFAVEVAPSLRLPSQVGNIYTGSLYLSLLSLLAAEADALAGQRIGLFSYGSGCAAEFFAGRVGKKAAELLKAMDVTAPLRSRQRLTIPAYEALRQHDADQDLRPAREGAQSRADPSDPAALAGQRALYCGIDPQERRVYTWQ